MTKAVPVDIGSGIVTGKLLALVSNTNDDEKGASIASVMRALMNL
jgi:hypothetical protein